MAVLIPYGDRRVELEIPGDRLLGVLAARPARGGNAAEMIREAAAAPVAGPPLPAFAEPAEPVLVLVNDATRPTPTAAMLEALWPEISSWDLSFLVATGTHRAPSEEEMRRIFGGLWEEVRGSVRVHDARDAARLVPVGRTAAGTEVRLDQKAMEAERLLVLSSVEAHYFAGYTGGRKIVLPGISGFDTIEQNHRLAMDERAQALWLEGNPVHEDMDEALGFLLEGRRLFSVLTVLDPAHQIAAVAAGEVRTAFLKAAAAVDGLFSVPIAEKADIVVAVNTPPLDIDFYQAQKAVENGRLALRNGGILIIVSACRTGIGNDAFLKLMRSAGTPEEVIRKAREDYHLGFHKAARLAEVAACARIWAVVGVNDETVRSAFMEPFPDIQSAVTEALAKRPQGRVWVLMDAGVTVPRPVKM